MKIYEALQRFTKIYKDLQRFTELILNSERRQVFSKSLISLILVNIHH